MNIKVFVISILCSIFFMSADAQTLKKDFINDIKSVGPVITSIVEKNISILDDQAKAQLLEIVASRKTINNGPTLMAYHDKIMKWCKINLPEENLEEQFSKYASVKPIN